MCKAMCGNSTIVDMRSLVALLALVGFCEAAPRPGVDGPAPSFHLEPFVVGGIEAAPHEFPWQLSMQRYSGVWTHSCGAVLLAANYALTVAHCVDGSSATATRVVAGLVDRTAAETGVISNLLSYSMHEMYNAGLPGFANDIAILTLATGIAADGTTIVYATLPADNNNDFAGETCTICGWGRASSSNVLPINLQKADITVITTEECNSLMGGGGIGDGQICVYDQANQVGPCNGDSGSPLNCEGGKVVAGVWSWGVTSGGNCVLTRPSVYTRTSYYLDWIAVNTP